MLANSSLSLSLLCFLKFLDNCVSISQFFSNRGKQQVVFQVLVTCSSYVAALLDRYQDDSTAFYCLKTKNFLLFL